MGRRRIFTLALSIAVGLTLAMIFTLSLMPPSINSGNLEAAGDLIGTVVGEGSALGGFLRENISNLAHLFEYFVLGVEVGLLFLIIAPARKYYSFLLSAALAVPFADETLQIFSGRHASISDMWIDVVGITAGFFTAVLLDFLKKRYTNRKNRKNG